MPKNLSSKIVEAISQDNPLLVTEAFNQAMGEICTGKLLELREEAAKSLFKENVEPDFETAIDFVLNTLETKGPSSLAETVKVASQNYNVNEEDIIGFLKESFDPVEEYQSLAEEVILGLCEMSEQGYEATFEFPNKTACIVTPEQSKAILNLWESLNKENRMLMEQKMTQGVYGFNQILDFAEAYVQEMEVGNA